MRRRQDGAQASLHARQRMFIRDKSARGPVSRSPLLLHMPPVFGVNLGRQEAIALYAPQTILRAYLSNHPPLHLAPPDGGRRRAEHPTTEEDGQR